PEFVAKLLEGLPDVPEARRLLAEIALRAPRPVRVVALRRLGMFASAPATSATRPGRRPGAVLSQDASSSPHDAAARAIWVGLRSSDDTIRRAAIVGCPLLGVAQGGALAIRFLADKDFDLRAGAARCLGRLRLRSAVPGLLAALGREPQVALLQALAAIGDRRATDAVLALLREDHPASREGERVEIIDALGRLGDPRAASVLERELAHPAWRVRWAAALALRRAGRSRSIGSLRVCEEDYYARVRAACRDARQGLLGAAPAQDH
ncbi:MAG: HEAT repeat domain-containing protein, partial [Deltaproteobacteria bacterium]|nr:HEAT repeat domain-containing protein [Deltaproteobacteria bacterium]